MLLKKKKLVHSNYLSRPIKYKRRNVSYTDPCEVCSLDPGWQCASIKRSWCEKFNNKNLENFVYVV